MKFIRNQIDKVKHNFEKGGKLHRYYYVFEAFETFLYSPNTVTESKGVQIRDAIDMKRLMMTVIIAMVPCLLFGIYNVGHQHFLATGVTATAGEMWWVGIVQVLPVIIVSYTAGLGIEFLFATFRHYFDGRNN